MTALPRRVCPRLRGHFFIAWLLPLAALAEPRWPDDPDAVLVELPAAQRIDPATASASAAERLSAAWHGIARHRISADLRDLGHAQSLITPLLDQLPRARLAMATILQRRHRFDAALEQLAHAESAGLIDPNLWLQRAALFRVQGSYDQALAACDELVPRTSAAMAALCRLPIESLTGDPGAAHDALASLPVPSQPMWRAWRASELAEINERLGNAAEARSWWQRALSLDAADVHARMQLAENFLRAKDAADVIALIDADTPHAGLQVLRLIARRQLDQGDWATDARRLATAIDRAERVHGERHDRERARVALDLLDDADTAARLAARNWSHQKEPLDALLLARAATVAGNPGAADPVRHHIARWQYRDYRLDSRFTTETTP